MRGKRIITIRGYSYGGFINYIQDPANNIVSDMSNTHELAFKKLEKEFEIFVIESMKKLQEINADALIPIVKFSYPPQRSFVMNEKRFLEYKYPENIFKRSQDLEMLYHDAGQFYFAKVDKFLECNCLVTESTIPYIISELEVQDIDNEEDWKIAEMKYQMIIKNKGEI